MSFWRIFPTPGHAAPLRPSPLLSPTLGPPIPIVYGQAYVPGRIVYVDSKPTFAVGAFWSIDHSRWEGALGLTVSKAVFVFCEAPVTSLGVALCNGRPVDISDGLGKFCAWSSIGVSVIGGISPEIIAGATSSIFATTGQGYEGTAHWRAPFLHRDGGIPQIQWKVSGACVRGGETYAHPADVLVDLLTNTRYGLGLTLTIVTTLGIDGLSASSFETYCNATGIRVNRSLTDQESAKDSIESLLAETNSVAIWSEGKLKIIPMDWRSKGAYHPPTSAVVLDEDEILLDGGRDPVTMLRTPDSDVFNHWPVRSKTADDNFAENVYGLPDALNVQVHGGIRTAPTTDSKWLATRQMVADYSAFLLSRSLHVRNRYRFRVGPRWCLLEPMDLITITDTHLGLDNEPCRIVTIEEQDDGSFLLEADEYPGSVRPVDMTPQPYDGAGTTTQGTGGGDSTTRALSIFAATHYTGHAMTGATAYSAVIECQPATVGASTGKILAAGNGTWLATSTDQGKTWAVTTPLPSASNWNGAAAIQVGGTYRVVMVGYLSATGAKIATSDDFGGTFTARTVPQSGTSGFVTGIINDGTRLVAWGQDNVGPCVWYSTDGVTWTQATLPVFVYSIAFNGSTYVGVTGGGAIYTASTVTAGAGSWTSRGTLAGSNPYVRNGVLWSSQEECFTVLGTTDSPGPPYFLTSWKSTDQGVTWAASTSTLSAGGVSLSSIGHNGSLYLASVVLSSPPRSAIFVSPDAKTWTAATVDVATDYSTYAITWLRGNAGDVNAWLLAGYSASLSSAFSATSLRVCQ